MKRLAVIFLLISTLVYAQDLEAGQPGPEQQRIIELCRQDLAGLLGVKASQIQFVSCENTVWNDSALGFPEKGLFYMQVLIDGYRIILSYEGRDYEYHTNVSDSNPVVKFDPKSGLSAEGDNPAFNSGK